MKRWTLSRETPDTVLAAIHRMEADASGTFVVCFDYFDTLVTRTVEPEYTKEIAAARLSGLLKNRFSGPFIYERRKQIEYALCLEQAGATGELEFTYTDLSRRLHRLLSAMAGDGVVPEIDQLHKEMLAIEVAVEKQVQRRCNETFQVLSRLHDSGVSLVLVTDFYLPETSFRELLSWHGIEDVFARVYISSVVGLSKGSGRIYPALCSDLGADPANVLMIGDNGHADIEMARQHGVRTLQIVRQHQRERPGSEASQRRCPGNSRKNLFNRLQVPKNLPFAELGISLWLFIHRLFEKLFQQDRSDVFFLSKEGEFLKSLFELYQAELFGSRKIRAHYLLASRKATYLASLRPLADEDFSRLFNHYRDISCRDFLLSLNFEDPLAADICAGAGLDYSTRMADFPMREEFAALRRSEQFRRVYEERRTQQRENFIAYLDSFGVDYREDGLSIVDVGWKGSIQDNIYHCLDKNVPVQGYYIGSLQATERSANNRKRGLLFDDHPCPSEFLSVYNNNRSLFEMMLGASHGSAKHYLDQESAWPTPADSGGNRFKNSASGAYQYVITAEIDEERHLFMTVVKPWQEQIENIFRQLDYAYLLEQEPPPAVWFARHHARAVFLPTAAEITFFEKLRHHENFGIFEITDFRTDHGFSFTERIGHLKNIILDPPILESGVWPPIILRRFGVGFWQFFDGRRRYLREFRDFRRNKVFRDNSEPLSRVTTHASGSTVGSDPSGSVTQ